MSDINLLPDELRDKEAKELESIRKKPKRISIDMSSPKRDVTEQPLRQSRPSLVSRLFTKKTKPGTPVGREQPGVQPKSFYQPPRAVEKVVNIPKTPRSNIPGLGASSVDNTSNTSITSDQAQPSSEDTASSFRSEESAGQEKVKVSARVEKVVEHIAGSGKSSGGFLTRLFRHKGASSSYQPRKFKANYSKLEQLHPEIKPDDFIKERDTTLDVNLIPEEMNRHPELEVGQKLFTAGMVAGFSVLLVLLGYFGLSWYQIGVTREAVKVEDEVVALDSQIKELEARRAEAVEFQAYLGLVRSLLDQHVYWSQFFKLLETHTSREVFFSNFSMSGTNQLVISAQALDYDAVAEQIVALERATDFIQAVRVDAVAAEVDRASGLYQGVTFTLSLDFIPGVFLNPIDNSN